MATINVGLLGLGTVGSGVAKILIEEAELIGQKLGYNLRLAKVCVRNASSARNYSPPSDLITTNPDEIVGNPNIPIVVELLGGLEPARSLVLKALASGQHVVTANKALLAIHGREIFQKATEVSREIKFEAAVAGAIPVIRVLKEGLTANRIQSVFGILNGTTNHILTRMTQNGLTFQDALSEAQKSGYAEADPTNDVEGFDAAHKLALLTALAYGTLPQIADFHVEGVTNLEPDDIAAAQEFGYVIKLLASSSFSPTDNRLEIRLHPAMLPKNSLMAGVNGVMNAVMIRGHACGDIFLSGAGAGMMPTASAVMGDIIEASRDLLPGAAPQVPSLGWKTLQSWSIKPQAEARLSYFLRLTVVDKPGVLSAISGVLGRHNISIAQVIQKGFDPNRNGVTLIILTHEAIEKDLLAALAETDKLDALTGPTRLIRVENQI
ncbi:MAG: homoserine dehydrogenase [Deltaproteobacteria bacterium]|nr:homoserine dehydrogenase [Deltaproteobacteria bacterium]